jgi:hypothetical protein
MKASTRLKTLIRHYVLTALILTSAWFSHAADSHSHMNAQQTQPTPDQKKEQNALLKIVRESTKRFQDVTQAEAEGYALQFGCVSGDNAGAMGLHFVNGPW